MKAIICKSVEYVPAVHIEKISGTTITLKSGKSFARLLTENAGYTMEAASSDNGDFVNHVLSLSFLEDARAEKLFFQYDMVFKVKDSGNNTFIIGSPRYPAKRGSLSKDTNTTKATFKAVSLQLPVSY